MSNPHTQCNLSVTFLSNGENGEKKKM